jgi:hypothetical protein
VRIGHEGTRHRDGQGTSVRHLLDCIGFEVGSPLTPWREFRTRREGRTVKGAGQWSTLSIFEERRWISDDVKDIVLDSRAVAPLRE